MIWSESVSSASALFGVHLFLTTVKSTQLRSTIVFRLSLIWRGFQYWVVFFRGERRVIKNTSSKQKQLNRSLCIVVILPWRTDVSLALFQVACFSLTMFRTLDNICCHYAYIIRTNLFKFNLFYLLLCVSDAPFLCYCFCIVSTDLC